MEPRPNRAIPTVVSVESRVHFRLISLSDPKSRVTLVLKEAYTISLSNCFHYISANLIRGLNTEIYIRAPYISDAASVTARLLRSRPGYDLGAMLPPES